MQVSKDKLNHLMMFSSSVEEIQANSPIYITFYPHRIFLDTKTLKVVLCSEIYSRGTAPRYNQKENIIFFADKVHLRMSLVKWGLAENRLDAFIEELQIAEVVEENMVAEPVAEEETIEITIVEPIYFPVPSPVQQPNSIWINLGYQGGFREISLNL